MKGTTLLKPEVGGKGVVDVRFLVGITYGIFFGREVWDGVGLEHRFLQVIGATIPCARSVAPSDQGTGETEEMTKREWRT